MIREVLTLLEKREYGNKIQANVSDVKNIFELSDYQELEQTLWNGDEGWYELTSDIFKIEGGSVYFVTNLRADYNFSTHEFDVVKRAGPPPIPKEAYKFTKNSRLKKDKKPIVFYHGTDADFDKFSNEFEGDNFSMGNFWKGMYFTEIKDDATIFGKNLKYVVINSKKPLYKVGKTFEKLYEEWGQQDKYLKLEEFIQHKGFDSIVHISKKTGLKTEVIVFDPKLIMIIKSV